jgi:hypothetical protein
VKAHQDDTTLFDKLSRSLQLNCIDRKCNMLPLSLDDLLNYTTKNVKVLYKQADMGFAAEAGLFLGGERVRFAPKKDVTLHPQAMDF